MYSLSLLCPLLMFYTVCGSIVFFTLCFLPSLVSTLVFPPHEKHLHIRWILSYRWHSTTKQAKAFFPLTWHALFGDLSVIDLLLQREVAYQSVDVTRLLLAVAVDAAHGLSVVARVPGGVEHHHAVRPDQVHTQTTSPEVGRGAQSGRYITFWHQYFTSISCHLYNY